ncbi:phage tail protein (plasmid) [Azospirillum melinis]|uniref:phage tail protein n=1 Tax=Azospirillum melinis TaxID=328839 RepID=UPI003756A581
MDAYLGLIFPFAGTFAPQGTAQCWGQDLPVSQNQALFAIISTLYGGTGNPNFKVPDLRGRVLMGSGVSPYLNATVNVASSGGTAASTLNLTNLPLHTHAASFTPGGGSSTSTINANVTIPISTAQANLPTPGAGTNYLGGVKVSDPTTFTDWQTEGPYTATAPRCRCEPDRHRHRQCHRRRRRRYGHRVPGRWSGSAGAHQQPAALSGGHHVHRHHGSFPDPRLSIGWRPGSAFCGPGRFRLQNATLPPERPP